METANETLYSVHLRDYPELPSRDRENAEQRFNKALLRKLGNAEDIALRADAGRRVSEDSSGDVSAGDLQLAKEWFKAYDVARQAGFNGLGESQEAYFDVRT
jgi:hypothetical protein